MQWHVVHTFLNFLFVPYSLNMPTVNILPVNSKRNTPTPLFLLSCSPFSFCSCLLLLLHSCGNHINYYSAWSEVLAQIQVNLYTDVTQFQRQ